ncbi:hypothetical protein LEMLEM_LOCUS20693, partial [Lemmus lemmus]
MSIKPMQVMTMQVTPRTRDTRMSCGSVLDPGDPWLIVCWTRDTGIWLSDAEKG